jgi:transcriptional antiterminator
MINVVFKAIKILQDTFKIICIDGQHKRFKTNLATPTKHISSRIYSLLLGILLKLNYINNTNQAYSYIYIPLVYKFIKIIVY